MPLNTQVWVVATPIGNLGDFSSRALEVLEDADLILAEDTRATGLLLKRLGLEKKSFLSLFEHNEEKRVLEVLAKLKQGKKMALVSNAGTPGVSDPGYRLIRAIRKNGYQISPVPGASAVLAALTVSGLPIQPFVFLGFLPRKSGQKEKVLRKFAVLESTLVLFERKSRLVDTLKIAYNVFGSREAFLARELTKQHEEFFDFRLGDFSWLPEEGLLGELTLVLGPGEKNALQAKESDVLEFLQKEQEKGGKPKEIADRVCSMVQGWSKKEIYDLYLKT